MIDFALFLVCVITKSGKTGAFPDTHVDKPAGALDIKLHEKVLLTLWFMV